MRMHMMSALQAENDGSRGKEEQGLEEGMCHQMEHPCHVRTHADSSDHEAEL